MMQRLVLGLGAGQCGLNLLADILGKQPGANVTLEQPPLLPWARRPQYPGMRERMARWRAARPERLIGDVATFYLPYAEEAIACEPDMRLICLKRPRSEVIANFCRHLDKTCPFPTNHWAREPSPGWFHDPLWSQTYPQYDLTDRVAGIGRYWDEYYAQADELARSHPQHFLLVDTDELTTPEGVRRVLTFAGVSPASQVVVTGTKPRGPVELPTHGPVPRYPNPLDPRRCVVLVPFSGFIHQECDNALKELERRGYQVRRVGGYAAIDQGRNQMSTDALLDGFDETLWIDSDVGFNPDDVEKLRAHALPIVCGIYPQKGKRALACHIMPGSPRMTFGQQGSLVELLYAGTGFLLIRREVYLNILSKLQLPVCNERFGHPMLPFYYPLIRPIEDGHWYLAEDYAFCERARRCGYKIHADTSIRLWHIGTYRYSWEDAGMDRPRFGTFTLNFSDQRERHTSPATAEALANFAANYPWPDEKPQVPAPPDHNWLFPAARKVLTDTVPPDAELIIEVGAWLGRSARFLSDLAPRAKIVTIDHWKGSSDHQTDPELADLLPNLYETFLAESWDYRDRIIPVRESSVDGLQKAADAGLKPDLVYLDGDHTTESVRADLTTALDRFPKTPIVGDDWDWPTVRQAVEEVAKQRHLKVEVLQTAWRILP